MRKLGIIFFLVSALSSVAVFVLLSTHHNVMNLLSSDLANERDLMRDVYVKRARLAENFLKLKGNSLGPERLARVRAQIKASIEQKLETENDFEAFDLLQNQISEITLEMAQMEWGLTPEQREQLTDMEREIERVRKSYHSKAIERNKNIESARSSPIFFFKLPEPSPYFKTDMYLDNLEKN